MRLADVSQGRHGAPTVFSVKIAAGLTPGHPPLQKMLRKHEHLRYR